MKKTSKKTIDIIFEKQCEYLHKRVLRKKQWGRMMTIDIDPIIHKRLAFYAADYGMSPTQFAPHILKEWILKMDRKGLTK